MLLAGAILITAFVFVHFWKYVNILPIQGTLTIFTSIPFAGILGV